jgi:flagellar assembly protein FliH
MTVHDDANSTSVPSGQLRPLFPYTRVLTPAAATAEEAQEFAAAVRAEAEDEARRLIREAERRAAEIVAEAMARREAIERAAEEAGRLRAAHDVQQLVDRLHGELAEVRARLAPELQVAAFHLARAVLAAEIELRPERLIRLVDRALEAAGTEGDVRVRVHPTVAPHLDAALCKRAAEGAAVLVRVVEDPELARHAVCLDVGYGTYLASVDDVLRPIARELGIEVGDDLV